MGAVGAGCAGGSPTSACVSVRLPPFSDDARVYLLVAGDPSGPSFGEYQVNTTCEPFTPCASDCNKGAARPGEDVHGELTPRSCSADGVARFDSWTIDVAEPTLLDLTVQGEGFAPELSLRAQDPGCSPLGSHPSGPDGFARLLRRMDPGSYTVVVTGGDGAAQKTGPYTLRVRVRGCPSCPEPGKLVCSPEAKLSGTLEAGDCADADGYLMDVSTLEVTALTSFSINTKDEATPYILMYRDGCMLQASFRPSSNTALSGYLLPGSYTVVILGFTPGAAGAYSIGFPCGISVYCREECEAGVLEPDIPVQGSLTVEDCQERFNFVDTWRFTVPEGAGASVFDFPTPPGTSVLFNVFSGSCDREIDLAQVCERLPPPLGGGWSCALDPGDYRLAISQQSFIIQQGGPLDYGVHLSLGEPGGPPTGFLPGDCNGDGALDIGDGICLLGHLFLGEFHAFACAIDGPNIPGPTDVILLDWDGTYTLNITDVVRLVNHLFMGGPGHILGDTCQPFPGCPPRAFNCRG